MGLMFEVLTGVVGRGAANNPKTEFAFVSREFPLVVQFVLSGRSGFMFQSGRCSTKLSDMCANCAKYSDMCANCAKHSDMCANCAKYSDMCANCAKYSDMCANCAKLFHMCANSTGSCVN